MKLKSLLVIVGTMALSSGLVGPVPTALAATITVNSTGDDNPAGPNDGDCTLREAITAANSDAAEDACPAGSGADTVVLPAGTYTLSVAGAGEDDNETGDLDILSSITIQGAGPAATALDVNGIDRGFDITAPGPLPSVEISGLTIRGADADAVGDGGGAIFNQESEALTLVNVALIGNKAIYGGGIANDGAGTLTVTDSLVAGNTALSDVGGGFDIDEDITATLTNVTVSGNSAGSGGGVWMRTVQSVTLNNVTVVGNSAIEGGAPGGIENSESTEDVILRNSIVAGNSNSAGVPDCLGPFTSQGYNLIGNNTGCTFVASTGDQVGTGATPIDAKVGPLADNGGPTMTHALLTGSPAIDAGNPAPPGSGGTACAATDQRGLARNCDIGAYELVLCGKVAVNRFGGPGKDQIVGTPGADGILGLGGKDRLAGKGGNDGLCGGPGKDTLKGGGGKDRLIGQGGKDLCVGQAGRDKARSCETKKSVP